MCRITGRGPENALLLIRRLLRLTPAKTLRRSRVTAQSKSRLGSQLPGAILSAERSKLQPERHDNSTTSFPTYLTISLHRGNHSEKDNHDIQHGGSDRVHLIGQAG